MTKRIALNLSIELAHEFPGLSDDTIDAIVEHAKNGDDFAARSMLMSSIVGPDWSAGKSDRTWRRLVRQASE